MCDILRIVEKEEKIQQLSIPAQRLIEKLSLLKNRKETAQRRWFWELLQNASDYNDTVSVHVKVTDEEVVFLHDGAPFSIRDVLNLISPDSNKNQDILHIDNIGKFGTGLVSTHILSSIISIKGICITDQANEMYHKFSFSLDRTSFTDKNKLIDSISNSKKEFKESLEETSSMNGFQTSFTYKLNNALPLLEVLNSEDIDLSYLYEMLPYTLCFMPKVKSVKISDLRNKNHEYSISRKEETADKISFEIEFDCNKEITNFAYFKYEDTSSVFSYADNTILPFPKCASKIFCGLPLIGTEDIGLPFILNSLQFEPTTEREGIELEPSSNEQNRKLMSASVILFNQILEYVEKNKLNDAYNLTNIRRRYNGTQTSNTQFYNLYLSKYKQSIYSHAIVKNALDEFISFSQTKLPFKDSKADQELYDNAFFMIPNNLPTEHDYINWFNATDFTLFTDQKYTYEDLANSIVNMGNLYAFNKPVGDTKNWLIKSLSYLKKSQQYIFAEKKLLPNQKGYFCKAEQLYVDQNLPSELKNIYNQLYEAKEKQIEDSLLDHYFNSLDVLNQQYTIKQLIRDIDEELAEQYYKSSGNTTTINKSLNDLYSWISKTDISKESLAAWFHWYYPKRASIIVDMLTESQREQALIIAQSGKIDILAQLASSDLSSEDFALLLANLKKLPYALSLLEVDDCSHADLNEGDKGERIVYENLLQKHPRNQGYKVIWASKDEKEPCYDFRIEKDNKIICYYDAKTTRRGIANTDSIPFFMRKSQWIFLQNLNDTTPYFIARVFMGDNGKIRYIRIHEEKQ